MKTTEDAAGEKQFHQYTGGDYALSTLYEVDASFVAEIREATKLLGHIYDKTVHALRSASVSVLESLGIPAELHGIVRLSPTGLAAVLARFDFAVTPEGLKMLEVNADTPCLFTECYDLNAKACRHFGGADPNAGLTKEIAEAFAGAVKAIRLNGFRADHIVFSSVDTYPEDVATALYLLKHSGLNATYAPLPDLRYTEEGLYVERNGGFSPVDLLYRLHPLTSFIEDQDQDGFPTGLKILELVAEKKLTLINPPSSLLAQTKATQALIWGLHEQGAFFAADEHETIARYMLPTYLHNPFHGKTAYVSKPFFGREGGAVIIYDEAGNIRERDGEKYYWDQSMVYQTYAPLERVTVQTLGGPKTGSILWGSFYLHGKSSAIGARFGGLITSPDVSFLPVSVKNDFKEDSPCLKQR